jgi:hypothetical protein
LASGAACGVASGFAFLLFDESGGCDELGCRQNTGTPKSKATTREKINLRMESPLEILGVHCQQSSVAL